mmetsp:Transcript_23039/g.45541  ORF Transcript_23039/g.45541 Transcript_23039/m.45541 type:complete len:571 (+) Transcript_23039:1914-3626(+)
MSEEKHPSSLEEYEESLHESALHDSRLKFIPPLPPALQNMSELTIQPTDEDMSTAEPGLSFSLKRLFPQTHGQKMVKFASESGRSQNKPLVVGVVLSGGQAPGGHNVIAGLFDAVKKLHPKSELIGFRNGPGGLVENKYTRITEGLINRYRNTGGFDMIGSGRTKIENLKQFQATAATVEALDLDGLVIIGGDDSNTNAALIAEYFKQNNMKCKCVGVPKTIDGDLSNEFIEISFGYDSCCKVYSNEIGNIARDARSAGKYWFFLKMMGRSASHITLECALQSRPNVALISEEVLEQRKTLVDITKDIADVVCKRATLHKHYGVVIIPEGLIEFIPEFQVLIQDLNRALATQLTQTVLAALKKDELKIDYIESVLSGASRECYAGLPIEIQIQLILDRDPHGNVSVSQIETERLIGEMVATELRKRAKEGTYSGKLDPRYHFCGYQGRAVFPSNFDAKYCYALGHVAVGLLRDNCTGYIACVRHLAKATSEWEPCGLPLTALMNIEERHGAPKPVIKKALVDLSGQKFQIFKEQRNRWAVQDAYRYTGPMQFFGPEDITEDTNFHVRAFL